MSHACGDQFISLCRGKRFLILFFLACLFVLFMHQGSVSAAESGSSMEAVKETIDQVLAILADEKLRKPEHTDERLAALENVINKRFDYEEMGKRTLGQTWKKLNAAQQKEFVELFQQFLSNTYAGNIAGISGAQVEYIKERGKGKFAGVQTKVISEKSEARLEYRLIRNSSTWRVYDVIIDGIGLVRNFRAQFGRIIKASGFPGLLDKLRSKIAQSPVK